MNSTIKYLHTFHAAILFVAICICLVSCRHTEATKDTPIIPIDVNQRSSASTIFSGYRYIPLEMMQLKEDDNPVVFMHKLR